MLSDLPDQVLPYGTVLFLNPTLLKVPRPVFFLFCVLPEPFLPILKDGFADRSGSCAVTLPRCLS